MKTALLIVGGNWNNDSDAGVRAANANNGPGNANNNIGFRASNWVHHSNRRTTVRRSVDTLTTPESCARTCVRDEHKTSRRRPVTPSGGDHRSRRNDNWGVMARSCGSLHPEVCAFDNLYRGYERARRDKRYRPDVLRFGSRLGENLLTLQEELYSLTWRPGPYQLRIIHEPKERVIRIAPFRDRVVHQAICAVVAPLFERGFIHDSYACRKGKGTHAALDRLTGFLRRTDSGYVLNADLRKFFDSISHQVLLGELERTLADRSILNLLDRIVASYTSVSDLPGLFRPHGMPIGNLTSQWFANIMGNLLDRFVKQELRCRGYVRYMDNFLLLSNDKARLRNWRAQIESFLAGIGLVLNSKTTIAPTAGGVPFLGFRVFSDHRRVLRQNVARGRRRVRGLCRAVEGGQLTPEEAAPRVQSWFAHLEHGDTFRLRAALSEEFSPYLEVQSCS